MWILAIVFLFAHVCKFHYRYKYINFKKRIPCLRFTNLLTYVLVLKILRIHENINIGSLLTTVKNVYEIFGRHINDNDSITSKQELPRWVFKGLKNSETLLKVLSHPPSLLHFTPKHRSSFPQTPVVHLVNLQIRS